MLRFIQPVSIEVSFCHLSSVRDVSCYTGMNLFSRVYGNANSVVRFEL